jgi:hypothetical protein
MFVISLIFRFVRAARRPLALSCFAAVFFLILMLGLNLLPKPPAWAENNGLGGNAIAYVIGSGIGVISLRVIQMITRNFLLIRHYPSTAEVISIRGTGERINTIPVMAMILQVSTREGTRRVWVQQSVDFGSMPRAGDVLEVDVSEFDPTAIRLQCLATSSES